MGLRITRCGGAPLRARRRTNPYAVVAGWEGNCHGLFTWWQPPAAGDELPRCTSPPFSSRWVWGIHKNRPHAPRACCTTEGVYQRVLPMGYRRIFPHVRVVTAPTTTRLFTARPVSTASTASAASAASAAGITCRDVAAVLLLRCVIPAVYKNVHVHIFGRRGVK